MDPCFGGGSWSMIAGVPTHSNASTPSNHDPYLQQQQQFHQQQQQQQQQKQRLLMQHQQTEHHQSLASHFPLLHLVENLADAIDNGARDQHVDALIHELNHFEKCNQLLNSVARSISTQSMTIEEQKRELEESEKMLNQRSDLVDNYPSSVEDLIKSEL